jgi:hypothetical protein
MDCEMRSGMRPASRILRSNRSLPGSFSRALAALGAAVLLAVACSRGEPKSGGKTLSEHFELLKSPDPEVRNDSAQSIASMAEEATRMNRPWYFEHRLPEMLEALRSPDGEVREKIVQAFFRLKEPTPGAIPQLLKLAKSDPDPLVSSQALLTLWRARADQMDLVLPFLIGILESSDDGCERCLGTVQTLANIGILAAPAIPAMLKICPEGDSPWCRRFHIALERIDPNWRERPEVRALLATTPAIGEDTPSSPEPER